MDIWIAIEILIVAILLITGVVVVLLKLNMDNKVVRNMKCPNCGAEVREEDKFCGECGKDLQREIEIAPKWKWGSMFVSLVLIFIFWMMCMNESYNEEGLIILLIFGFPATIYLMYKERTEKMKYGLIWVLFPTLVLLFSLDGNVVFGGFLFMAIPAIVIDVIYVIYKTK